ncbi:helix-turn-helix domain-containing protein [Frankia sp. CNm7]|uniref:Helix-turn-helix domain-containing protein n=1 Tax=Frankia nepalensis TaxID=1836974 RepID=A0A937RCC3_9ACTN|nr:IclR family transcriptional regulator C-terminal domain-containing protein [Frankia nepalensis]MBL7497983.1 helix-turn-helix domain-containing protein [Frankia nepalensis]MBL7509064.1 helix-turn-helix domain-containing protein [Frankia nepalensis]MBL7516833.1 helix-turn-helix domain-containing protein [Frankia nepalensis]MBL7627830.1 helix-turn-helix domain-containing protein [Frankia nepalensis]
MHGTNSDDDVNGDDVDRDDDRGDETSGGGRTRGDRVGGNLGAGNASGDAGTAAGVAGDGVSPTAGGVRSIHRAFAALELLVAAAPRAVRTSDVAAHLEVDPATASRLLATLLARGYATRTPQRRYTVGPRSLRMAVDWMERLRAASDGPITRVARATGETVLLCQLLGGGAVPIAARLPAAGPPARIPPIERADGGYPIWATAAGRALLAALPAADRRRVLPPEPYPTLTGQTPTTWPRLRDAIRAGSRHGVHFEHGETIAGLWCYATPLLPGSDGEILALAVVATGDLDTARHARITRTLRAESRAVADHLAHTPA